MARKDGTYVPVRRQKNGLATDSPPSAPSGQRSGPQDAANASNLAGRRKSLGLNIQPWSDEGQSPRRSGSRIEALLWLTFFLLLSLVIVFSQRHWLIWLFPFGSRQELPAEVEILRPNPSEVKQEPDVSIEKAQTLLQQFDQLLRLNAEESEVLEDAERTRDVRLFFVRVKDDGQLQLRSVLHKVPFDQTPLSRTIEKLFEGPSPQEINKGLHSMLPPEMQVLSIRIVGATAFINLSEEFYQVTQLSALLLAAVKQLVFTITEYPNVKALRILVEGQPIFADSLPEGTAKELEQQGLNLNSEIRREDLWQGEMGDFTMGP